jgi:DNA-binding NtrC family response regulator
MEPLPVMCIEQSDKSPLAGKNVLIVEDEKLVAFDVESMMSDFGAAKVWSAGTLAEARRILVANKDVSIVLLDIKLQDGSGEELLAELAEADIPVIITTGYAAYVSALAPVLCKPYSTAGLLAKILETLSLASA